MRGIFLLCAVLWIALGCGDNEERTKKISRREISCQEAKEQVLGEECSSAMSRIVGSFKEGKAKCQDDLCELYWWSLWALAIDQPCNPGFETLLRANGNLCGPCYASCSIAFNLVCLSREERSGIQCLNELYSCIEGCEPAPER